MAEEIGFVGDGKRVRVEIDGENYYLTIGENFVVPTAPHENRPEVSKIRRVVETLCKTITKIQEGEGTCE